MKRIITWPACRMIRLGNSGRWSDTNQLIRWFGTDSNQWSCWDHLVKWSDLIMKMIRSWPLLSGDQRDTCADGALGIARKLFGPEKSLPCLPSIDSLGFWSKDFLVCCSFVTWDIGPRPSSLPAGWPSSVSFPKPSPPSLGNPPPPPPPMVGLLSTLPSTEAPPMPRIPPKEPPRAPRFGASSSTSSFIAKQSGWSGSLMRHRQWGRYCFFKSLIYNLWGREGPWGNELIVLNALAASRERWDLRWSLRLPLAVYILPQKSQRYGFSPLWLLMW